MKLGVCTTLQGKWSSSLSLSEPQNGMSQCLREEHSLPALSKKKLYLLVNWTLSCNVCFKEPSYATRKLSYKTKHFHIICY